MRKRREVRTALAPAGWLRVDRKPTALLPKQSPCTENRSAGNSRGEPLRSQTDAKEKCSRSLSLISSGRTPKRLLLLLLSRVERGVLDPQVFLQRAILHTLRELPSVEQREVNVRRLRGCTAGGPPC